MSAKNGTIRVVVAATSAVRRGGLESIVRENAALKLLGSVPGLAGLAPRVLEMSPEVLVADLPHADPQFVATAAALDQAGIAVVALVDEPDAGWTARALSSGVRAVLPRESSASEIVSAIVAAHDGLILLDPDVARELASQTRSAFTDASSDGAEDLTAREIEVLRRMADGLGNKEIAARLGISEHTVKFHISSILAKLGAASRTEAVTQGIRMGLILL
jgi:two-component system, NarL family, response regulator YdfI